MYEENGRKILHGFYLVKPNLKYYMGLGLVGALNVSRIHTSSSKKFGFG